MNWRRRGLPSLGIAHVAAREWAEYEAEMRARGRIKPAGSKDSFDDMPADNNEGSKVSRRESERSRR